MPDDPNPTLARRRLAVRLRQARDRNGRSLDDLAKELAVSLPQASRLDSGARGYKADQVARLGDWYSLGAAERTLLDSLVRETRRRAWWQQVDLPDSYRTLIGLEQGAATINEYGAAVLPGLMQTAGYAQAAVRGSTTDVSDAAVEQAVLVRLQRQGVLSGKLPPVLWVVIDESALARTTGTREVMREQLEHLLDMSRRPRVTMQVIGFEAGTHLGTITQHFILLGMGQGLPDVVYAEAGRLDPSDTEDPEQIETYRRIWDLLRSIALDEVASRRRVDHYLQLLRE